MDLPPALGIAAVLVLVLANGFFVATEFAIVAVRRSRLEELVRDGRTGAAGRFPHVGEVVAIAGRRLRIEARDGMRVSAVQLLPERTE